MHSPPAQKRAINPIILDAKWNVWDQTAFQRDTVICYKQSVFSLTHHHAHTAHTPHTPDRRTQAHTHRTLRRAHTHRHTDRTHTAHTNRKANSSVLLMCSEERTDQSIGWGGTEGQPPKDMYTDLGHKLNCIINIISDVATTGENTTRTYALKGMMRFVCVRMSVTEWKIPRMSLCVTESRRNLRMSTRD